MIKMTWAFVIAVMLGMFLYNPVRGQGSQLPAPKPLAAKEWEWKSSDYGGATLYHHDKVVGVQTGSLYFGFDKGLWFHSKVPTGAPKYPGTSVVATTGVTATVQVTGGGCGASGARVRIFHRERAVVLERIVDAHPVRAAAHAAVHVAAVPLRFFGRVRERFGGCK